MTMNPIRIRVAITNPAGQSGTGFLLSSSPTIVVVRPNYDSATGFTSKWAEEIVEYARQKGIRVIDLYGNAASPEKFEEALRKAKPKMVVHYGHAREDALLGQYGRPLLTLDNLHLVERVLFYIVGCHSGKRLTQAILDAGGIGASAFSDRFIFNPFNEDPYRESVNSGVKALIEGKTFREACQVQQQTFMKWIRQATQQDLDFMERSVEEIKIHGSASRSGSSELWASLCEAYELRRSALKIEMQDLDKKERKDEIGGIILQAFRKIEAAQQAYGATEGLTPEQRKIASEKLEYAKMYWVARCQKCGLVNPLNRHHCSCGTPLCPEFMIRRR
jgi:hypothetical protein